MRNISSSIFLCVLLLSGLVSAEPQLSVTGNAYQGSALFVRVTDDPSPEAPTLTLEGRTYRAVPAGKAIWEAVVPLSIDATARQTLTVETAGGRTWERPLTVKSRNYGHQSISLPASTLAGYDDPQNKADDAAIKTALTADTTERLFEGRFDLPVQAPQTTGFGLKRTYNGWKKGWHKGLDLAGWEGEPVAAPADGVVIHTARGVVNGNTVVLSHGAGVGSTYLHLNSISVQVGQQVRRGQTIGTVGGTGGFAPHLHWEVRVQGEAVHPKVFFQLPQGWR